MQAFLRLIRHFGWTWVGVLFIDDYYGNDAAPIFRDLVAQTGSGCISYFEALPWDSDPAQLTRIVTVMKKSTARVVIALVYGIHVIHLMEEVGVTVSHCAC